MRAAIFGAGAMGTVLGAFIARSGMPIDLVTRNREHVAALKAHGAHITGGVDFTVGVSACLPEEMTGVYDVVFLMTKQRHNARTVTWLKDYLAPDGVVCTMQNGLPERSVAEIVGEDRCLGCAVSWGATFVGRGEAKLTSSPDKLTFAVGSVFGENERVARVIPYLECMGTVTAEHNFIGARWSKLIVNSAFSTLSALTGLTFGQIARRRKTRKVAQAMLKEGMDAASAEGVTCAKIQGHDLVKLLGYQGAFKKAVSFHLIPLAMKKHRSLVSGMYYDLKSGKECDVDFVSGVVVQSANTHGLSLPVTERAVELIHRAERGETAPSPERIDDLIPLL